MRMRGKSHYWEKIFTKDTLDALNQIFFASSDSCFCHHYSGHSTWAPSSPLSGRYSVKKASLYVPAVLFPLSAQVLSY